MKRPPVIVIRPDEVDDAHRSRFQAKVTPAGDCLEWTGAVNSSGYGVFRLNGRQVYAHRLAWILATQAAIPDGMTIDHLCRNTRCVNAAHLETVTPAENTDRQPNAASRRTHCPQNHPYVGDNLYRFPDGRRACRTCMRAAQRRYADRKKATA